MNIQKFAQKAIVINSKNQILMIKYGQAKYQSEKVAGKWAIPGGKIEIGESPEQSIISEVLQETGVVCKPDRPVNVWNWEYQKGEDRVQINAVSRVCWYESGKPKGKTEDLESTIEEIMWIDKDNVLDLEIVVDERPCLEMLIKNWVKFVD